MLRIGFDIGGSKIAAIALDPRGREIARLRRDVPRDYPATLAALAELSEALQHGRGPVRSIGIGMPGLIRADGVPIRVANLPWLEGRPLQQDLNDALRVPVAIANDANCLALSEAVDGAAAGASVVFGAILGTGVGGGIVVEGKPLAGAINILDPDAIVLGGGLSSIASLYEEVPKLWAPLTVAAAPRTRLAPARFGPESGLRGAAWLGRPPRIRSRREASANSPR
jgi:predicted NBD/HSP70 family sugar kinase